jgi:uncharacterized protein YgbK (DUF1537 family)
MRFGSIADDITGATDLASVCRRAGLATIQTVGLPDPPLPEADVIVVSLKIRTAPAADAVALALRAADVLRDAGARQQFFKYCSTFDSTPHGNIGPVMHALQARLDAPFTVACPAYPALGRTSYLGHLFVGGVLLSESPMRHHPLTPMTDADLVRVLREQYPRPVGLLPLTTVDGGAAQARDSLTTLAAAGCGAAIVDAVWDRHITAAAEACADLRLATGGAAFGGALAAWHGREADAGTAFEAPGPADGTVAVLSGSCSAATREQLTRVPAGVPRHRIDPIAIAEDHGALESALAWAREHARSESLVVYSSADPDAVAHAQARLGREGAAAAIERAFAAIARELAAAGVRVFVVAGGETSGAVLQALEIRSLAFGRELAPGVPWARSLQPGGFSLALKSGNFGGADFFAQAMRSIHE